MADKGRRAAARQGQLSRRRKKGQRGPSGIPQIQHPGGPAAFAASTGSIAETRDAAAAAAAESDADSATATATAAPAATSRRAGAAPGRAPAASPAPSGNGAAAAAPASAAPRGQAAPRSPRSRNERPPAYNYVGAELRRIGVLSLSVVAALVVLGIVL